MPNFVKKRKKTPKRTRRRLGELTSTNYKFQGQARNRQMQSLICNAYKFFRREKLKDGPVFDFQKAS